MNFECPITKILGSLSHLATVLRRLEQKIETVEVGPKKTYVKLVNGLEYFTPKESKKVSVPKLPGYRKVSRLSDNCIVSATVSGKPDFRNVYFRSRSGWTTSQIYLT